MSDAWGNRPIREVVVPVDILRELEKKAKHWETVLAAFRHIDCDTTPSPRAMLPLYDCVWREAGRGKREG